MMWLRLRQICLVAENLAPVEEAICEVLGVQVCFRDPAVEKFGLENALFPIGNQFLEVVAPTEANTAAGRYLERRGGDRGYMVITQCDDHAPRRKRVAELGVRIAHEFKHDDFLNMQLHPRDTGGAFFEIDEQLGPKAQDLDGPWLPAGSDWKSAQVLNRVSGIATAEIQCDDVTALSQRWSDIAEIPLTEIDGAVTMPLDNATVRFVECTDGRPEGLGGLDIIATDRRSILESAEARGAVIGENKINLCGIRINLI